MINLVAIWLEKHDITFKVDPGLGQGVGTGMAGQASPGLKPGKTQVFFRPAQTRNNVKSR